MKTHPRWATHQIPEEQVLDPEKTEVPTEQNPQTRLRWSCNYELLIPKEISVDEFSSMACLEPKNHAWILPKKVMHFSFFLPNE